MILLLVVVIAVLATIYAFQQRNFEEAKAGMVFSIVLAAAAFFYLQWPG